MANRFTINVQPHKPEDKAEAEEIASALRDFLNEARFRKAETIARVIGKNIGSLEVAEHLSSSVADSEK